MTLDKFDEDSTLPKATVDKLLQDLTPKPYVISKETRNVMREAAHKLLSVLSLESNRLCDIEKKKTISTSHVFKSLKTYGFEDFIEECDTAAKNYEDYLKLKPSKQNKFKNSGKSLEELEEEQQGYFKKAAEEQKSLHGIIREDTEEPSNE